MTSARRIVVALLAVIRRERENVGERTPNEDRQARLQTRSVFLFAGVNRTRFSAIRVVDVVGGGIRN